MVLAQFSKCSEEVKKILHNEQFGAADFWEGYKLYCFAHYSHCDTSKLHFQVSKMGRVMCSLQSTCTIAWGAQFDQAIREAWTMMEEYVHVRHGKDCTNLKALMEEFDDVKKLSMSSNGCLLLQLIEDDEHATERLHRESLTVQLNMHIFDEVRGRLHQAEANLAKLSPRR